MCKQKAGTGTGTSPAQLNRLRTGGTITRKNSLSEENFYSPSPGRVIAPQLIYRVLQFNDVSYGAGTRIRRYLIYAREMRIIPPEIDGNYILNVELIRVQTVCTQT